MSMNIQLPTNSSVRRALSLRTDERNAHVRRRGDAARSDR
jgi:hypothetical protein